MYPLTPEEIFTLEDNTRFNDLALKIFNYQAENNPVYKEFLYHLGVNLSSVDHYTKIPFLPISFFKSHRVLTFPEKHETVFYSSGTTGKTRSKHYIKELKLYEKSFRETFTRFYGKVEDYCILALLPTYLENENSSLVYMVNQLINQSTHPRSDFYLDKTDTLARQIEALEKSGQRTILLGVSYALMDLAEKYPMQLSHTIIIETGGMKGTRKELTKKELHQFLSGRLGVEKIHSEYGMTELLSQAYSKGDGRFFSPPWLKVLIRDTYDPFSLVPQGRSGGINIIDLANIHSCSFIETQDLGKINPDGSFEVLGRFDNSDIRGCNLLVAE
ncbi:MAG: acyltransferase [Bacteroidales bacterium]|jgi:phenylacetate-coenzyme A ligase PaaK-like adenylate-forming protein|nr:acyltransferase [Bacteroidales bacterium]